MAIPTLRTMADNARLNPPVKATRGKILFVALVISLAALAAYSNSLSGPFINDDYSSIVDNSSIKQGLFAALHPPVSATVTGRPLVNFSLALDYDLTQLRVESYHATNLMIHLLAGLVLLGLVRRTLELPSLRADYGQSSLALAAATALLWMLHPLQTNAVTYTIQRAEALMGLFFLLALYCFVRGEQSAWTNAWRSLAVAACLCSALCKEVAVTIPFIIFLYDRAFMAGTFGEAWSKRKRWYWALGGTWLPLGWMVYTLGTRGGSAGYGTGVGWWEYAQSQFKTIVIYLELSVWPHPLQHNYGTGLNYEFSDVVPFLCLVVGLLAGTAWLLWRRPKLGFLAAWIFIILAPTSSLLPIKMEPMAEHRMYLPLVAPVMLIVLALWKWAPDKLIPATAALALAWGTLTFMRNEDYRTEFRIYRDVISKSPENFSEHAELGELLATDDRPAEALGELYLCLKFDPGEAAVENALAEAYATLGNDEAAVLHYKLAIRYQPEAQMYVELGNVEITRHRYDEAAQDFDSALRLQPLFAQAEYGFGNVYAVTGQLQNALIYYERAVAHDPKNDRAFNNLGTILFKLGRASEAKSAYEAALRLNPNLVEARDALNSIQPVP